MPDGNHGSGGEGGLCDICSRLHESTAHYTSAPWYRCDGCAQELRENAERATRTRRYLNAMSGVYARRVRGIS